MGCCEQNHVNYVFGWPKLTPGEDHRRPDVPRRFQHQSAQKVARIFAELRYRTRKSWSRTRPVGVKAEYLDQGENPRFVVTSLGAGLHAGRRPAPTGAEGH